MVALIVAYASNGVIGKQNDLPWYLPADLQRFKQLTTGQAVIMGRKTFESIMKRLGHPLPNRLNIVLTSSAHYDLDDVRVAASLAEALQLSKSREEVFIIGGASVFEEGLKLAERVYATEVKADIPGDVYFPDFNKQAWREVSREPHSKDDKNQYDFDFVTYERRT